MTFDGTPSLFRKQTRYHRANKTNNIFIWENRDNPTLEAPLPVGHIKKRKKKAATNIILMRSD
jgi:hypothetical protein